MGAMVVMLTICALTMSVRAQSAPAPVRDRHPPLHADLHRFAAADAAGRDAIIHGAKDHLVDRFRQLLRVAVSERAGLEDATLPGDMDELVVDFARRIERITGQGVFADDAAHVLALSEREITLRARLHLGFFTTFRLVRFAEPDAVAPALARLDGHLERMALFAHCHEDRDLARFTASVRPLVDGYRPDHGTPAGRARWIKHTDALATVLSEQGLDKGFRYFIAERNLAQAFLLTGAKAKAGAALRAARRAIDVGTLGLEQQADLLSLELEHFRGHDYLEAARSAANDLETLLPRVEKLIDGLSDRERRVELQTQLAHWYLQAAFARAATGREQRAHELLMHAAGRPGVRSDTAARIRVLLAQVSETLGDYQGGVRAARDAIDLTRDPGLRWQAHLHEAACYALLGRVGDARRSLEAVKQLRTRLPEPSRASLASRDALVGALVRKMAGDLNGALADCDRALAATTTDGGSVDRVRALWFKSGILLEVGEAGEALDVANEARASADDARVNPKWQAFVSDLGIADILLSSGRPAEARARLDDAMKIGRAFLDAHPELRGEARRLRAEAEWRLIDEPSKQSKRSAALMRDLDSAIGDLKRASRGRFGVPRLAVETLRAYELLFEISVTQGDSPAADGVVDAARAFVAGLDRSDRGPSLAWSEVDASMEAILARAAEAAGESEQALLHYKKAARLENELRKGLRWRAPDGLSARFEGIHDRMAYLHLDAAEAHNTAGRVREALLFIEDRRARSLRTLISAAEVRLAEGARDGLASEEIGLQRPPTLDGEGLDEILIEGRTVLVYAVTARGGFVLGLRGRHAEIHRLRQSRTVLERNVHSLRSNLRGEPDSYKIGAVMEFGNLLYDALISPVAHLVKDSKEIIIVPDGVLHAVPFGALTAQDVTVIGRDFTKIPFLVAQPGLEALTITPSLATLALLRERPAPVPERSALLIGDPSLNHAAYPALPHARREIATIAELLERPTVLVGDRANLKQIGSTKPGRHGIIHVASHTRRGRLPSILLAPSGPGGEPVSIGPSDVMGLKLDDTSLVVLSACASGRGRLAGAEGLIGLPRAFLVAGARRVVASSIDVIDEKTSRLMKLLYARMRVGDAPARALLRAQRTLLGSPATSWPGYWAPFFVVGAP